MGTLQAQAINVSLVSYSAKQGLAMSGFLRNVIAVILGLFAYGRREPCNVTDIKFLVTPFDCGVRVVKSDKYLQYAETAQIDYLIQVGKLFRLITAGVSFVNVAQLVRFFRPVPMFSIVYVKTHLVYANDRCAYFQHTMHSRDSLMAEILVKVKFKKGRLTVSPQVFFPIDFLTVPAIVAGFESALETPNSSVNMKTPLD